MEWPQSCSARQLLVGERVARMLIQRAAGSVVGTEGELGHVGRKSGSAQPEGPRPPDADDQASGSLAFSTSPGGPAVLPHWPSPGSTNPASRRCAASACDRSSG